MAPHVVLLNGTSSSGKTSIAERMQDVADDPYILTGFDAMASRVPLKFDRTAKDNEPGSDHPWFEFVVSADDGQLVELRIGEQACTLMASMYRSAADLVRSGISVIVDDVLFDPRQVRAAISALVGLPVWYVGVRCPFEVAQQREAARGDRRVGLVRTQFDVVHAHGDYDLEIDTSVVSAQQGAERVLSEIASGRSPAAFAKLIP